MDRQPSPAQFPGLECDAGAHRQGQTHPKQTQWLLALPSVGINEYTNATDVNVYPNPATDIFYIQSNTKLDNATIEVYDMLGQKVLVEKLNNNLTRLNVAHLNNAIYQIQVVNNTELIYKSKFVKQ